LAGKRLQKHEKECPQLLQANDSGREIRRDTFAHACLRSPPESGANIFEPLRSDELNEHLDR